MDNLPICNKCNNCMEEGYVIDNGLEYYCSKECLNSKYSDSEYEQMFKDDYAFWTTYED